MAATVATLLRIVTNGLQDRERLNAPRGQPSVAAYTSAIRRRTRWASRWERVEFDNVADFGRKATVTLPVLGDLVTRATLVVELPDIVTPQVSRVWSWTNGIGHAVCSDIELQIGGATIDRLDSRLMEVLDESTRPTEHFDSYNALLCRDPSGYAPATAAMTTPTTSVEIVPPFWWNRGIGPQALPLCALTKDRVQIAVTFRTLQECVYTTQRTPSPDNALPPFTVLSPAAAHFRDAFWVVEYVTLEDREATAFRHADLHYPIEQHIAVPPYETRGARAVRIPIEQTGLIRDMTWVAQRVEAPAYNAYFLFSRDLSATGAPSNQLWWPNARIPNWNYGDGYLRPAFVDRRSDPIDSATLWTGGLRRFQHEGVSLFRSLVPALGSARCPLVDRYIYRYDFGFWPTGGLAEALTMEIDEVRGAANWDRLQKKELALTMNSGPGGAQQWADSQTIPLIQYGPVVGGVIGDITADMPSIDGFQVVLVGGGNGSSRGAIVQCTVDMAQIQRLPMFRRLLVRVVSAPGTPVFNGSAALVAECGTLSGGYTYVWLAVAGSSGTGMGGVAGGNANNACDISFQGGNSSKTHNSTGAFGGGGGGRLSTDPPGPGLPDGGNALPTTDRTFVMDTTRSNGGQSKAFTGGDGYFGGGSGDVAGGGGGSFVGPYVSQVSTQGAVWMSAPYATVQPLVRVPPPTPNFNIHIWLTRYNLLRVGEGHAALMFSD